MGSMFFSNMIITAQQVGALFLMVGLGFVLSRRKKLSPVGVSQMIFLLINIGNPCAMVKAFWMERSTEMLRMMWQGALIQLGLMAVLAILSCFLFRSRPVEQRAPMRVVCIYGNAAFMGIPLIQAILGDEGVLFTAIAMIPYNIAFYTHGIALMGGREQISPKKVLYTPAIWAVCIGVVMFAADLRFPPMVESVVTSLGSLNTPLAMLLLGAQIGMGELKRGFRESCLYGAALVRLIVAPLMALLFLLPLHLDPVMYTVFVVLAGVPGGASISSFAAMYHRDAELTAKFTTFTTLVSIVTLPCFAALAQVISA